MPAHRPAPTPPSDNPPPALPASPGTSVPTRRQWGTDRRTGGLAMVTPPASRRAVSGARFALFLTVAAWVAYVVEQTVRVVRHPPGAKGVAETVAYLLIVTLLTSSAAAYLLTRLGHLNRSRTHRRVPRSLLDDAFEDVRPPLTVIVPSYREDARVVRQTLLSAALQEYPDLRVVLLIDDPSQPRDGHHRQLLQQARDLPGEIELLLEGPRQLFQAALTEFANLPESAPMDAAVLEELAANYDIAAQWFRLEATGYQVLDHSDAFLLGEVFQRHIDELNRTAVALRAAGAGGARISRRRVTQLYRRLVWIFRAELSSFERKAFASLSHEANKAMNLNSYIGLMGGRYRIESAAGGDVLLATPGELCDLDVPDPTYVLTLDADSMLLPEYCLRLVHFMEQPDNAEVAVVQTPYSAYRGATKRIERIAGATTDLQHLVHQGLAAYNATFWVGANAVLRKSALNDMVVEDDERGFVVRRYVQDRTVIEDTESSVDLRAKGWRLHNYPERLSYSATPADFGSLVVQRQRWANGGLVILPKMLKLMRSRPVASNADATGDADAGERVARLSLAELFLRTNYLASITWASVGLLALLCYPFEEQLLSRLAVLTALPYFVAIANDLRRCGYKRSDALRLYGFNLLLLPVNLAGTVQSVTQAIGGQKIAFARTPKVAKRTVAPLSFVVLPWMVVAWSLYTLARDVQEQAYLHAAFAGFNGALTAYAVLAFVGLRHSVADVVLNLREKMYRSVREPEALDTTPDWVTVLYHGASDACHQREHAPLAVALAAIDQQRASIALSPLQPGGLDLTDTENLVDLTDEEVHPR